MGCAQHVAEFVGESLTAAGTCNAVVAALQGYSCRAAAYQICGEEEEFAIDVDLLRDLGAHECQPLRSFLLGSSPA